MVLSVVIPAHNEASCLAITVNYLVACLQARGIKHEILIVNDGSTDETAFVIRALETEYSSIRYLYNRFPNGYGFAVRAGLEQASGDVIAVYMADGSDRPQDLVRYYRVMQEKKVDCVFGSRFTRQSRLVDYPWPKLILNRLGNTIIQLLFGLRYNDITNAFKLYRREVIEGLRPFLSHHFNLTVELPLKAIVRGFSYEVVPNDWINRKSGESKLKIKEMGSRYLFIVLYCWIEKFLSRGDYHKDSPAVEITIQKPTEEKAA